MVLILNCMKDDVLAQSFDSAISRPIQRSGEKAFYFRLSKSGEVIDVSRYSHLIISGSEASVVDDNPWEDRLEKIILQMMEQGKPVLGICYGHQFLARALMGKGVVRKSKSPEFGWLEISLSENPLFREISPAVFMVSHYDEVCCLDSDFKILAGTPRCGIHAFQYKDLPVWGIQFHPEYNIPESDEIFKLVKKRDASFPDYYFDSLRERFQPEQNEKIFLNFLDINSKSVL